MALEDVSAVAEPIEAPAEETEEAATPGEETPESTEAQPEAPAEEPAEEFTVDGRTIPANVRELFKSPSGGKEVRAAWMERGEFRKTFPEGPKQAKEIMSIIADIGGREGIDTLKGEADGLRELNQMFATGDAKAIDKLISEAPEGFAKLAPEVMTKWYQVDPEGCNKTLCGVIANTLSSGNFNNAIERCALFLEVGKPEKAIEVLQSLQKWADSFGEVANKPVTPKQQAPEVDKRAQELDQREAQIFNKDLSSKIVSFRDPLIEKELAPWIPKGQTLSDTKKQIINREVVQQASAILDADSKFQKDWKSFIANKDVDGAVKLSRSKMTEILPGVVETVARELLGSPAVKKTAPATPIPKKTTPAPIKGDSFDDIFDAATRA